MPILMKRKDGTITPYRNAEFIPAYLRDRLSRVIWYNFIWYRPDFVG